jgi:UPF0271 protein
VERLVLDSSALIEGFVIPNNFEVYVPPGVAEEVRDKSIDFNLIKIVAPSRYNTKLAVKAAKETGDFPVLSNIDIQIIALALQLNAKIITDDYAIQNVASHLGLEFEGLHQEKIKEQVKWKWKCTSCGRYFNKYYEQCPVCGGKLKRVRISAKKL